MSVEGLATISRAMRSFVMSANHHVGGSLSPVDFLTGLYFSSELNLDVSFRARPDRDKYVHSKGHAAAAHYFALWLHGYLGDVSLDELLTFGATNHRLPRIPQRQISRGIEMTTGSLGQGLSFGNGLALADARAGRDCQTVVLMGDAELSEGQVWEAAQTTVRLGLENVTVAIDANGFGSHMSTRRDDIAGWWRGFGWDVLALDGHDMTAVVDALAAATSAPHPTVLLLQTVKGFGLLPPYCDSPNAGGEVPAAYRPPYDLAEEVAAALAWTDQHFSSAGSERDRALPTDDEREGRPLQIQWAPDRNPVGEVVVTKRFAEELVDHIEPGGDCLVISPDAIRNSGLLPMLDRDGSWSTQNTKSAVLEHQIAEQDVASLAAGVTSLGTRTVVFLMEGFVWRMIDSLRQSICFSDLPVVVVGTSAGLGDELGQMVQSDTCFQAVAGLPGLVVLEACDINEAKVLLNHALASNRPAYLRLPHEALKVASNFAEVAARDLTSGAWIVEDSTQDPDLVIVSAGSMMQHARNAATVLRAEDGVQVRLVNVFSVTAFAALPRQVRETYIPHEVPSMSVHNGPVPVLERFLGRRSQALGLVDYGMHGKPVQELYDACGLGLVDIVSHARALMADD